MRLEYKILWFEDDSDFVNKKIGPQIERFLFEELGFDPIINHRETVEKLDELVLKGNYDLIVTDLNLVEDDDEEGKKLIEHIRSENILTEVLLYSGDSEAIRRIITEGKGMLPRVSFAVGRKDLPDRLKKIIDLTVRKVQDVNNMRGVVIAESIDLEEKMLRIINQYFTVSENKAEKEVFIKEHLDGTDKYLKKQLEGISGYKADQIIAFVDKACETMFPKHQALQKLVSASMKKLGDSKSDQEKKAALSDLKKELNKMNNEVIDLRNDLAHVKEEKNSNGISILRNQKKGRKTVFDSKKYIKIRKSLKSHAKNLIEIEKRL